ncbi:MAG: hypothetical protein ACJAYI_001732 [Myxococcota bacterium]|jgi:hypothetical protein
MSQPKPSPIFSTSENDPAQTQTIDRFVVTLAEEVDRLQDAELECDFGQLSTLATQLGERAQALGYLPMAQIASTVARACREEKLEEARAAMLELTDTSSRIRRGHRGSA